jgi:hypothetical protein
MQHERDAAEMEKTRTEMQQRREDHVFKMTEIYAKNRTMQIQPEQKRRQARAQKPAQSPGGPHDDMHCYIFDARLPDRVRCARTSQ